MGSNVHRLPCGRSEHEDYGCIDCGEYKACKLWAVVRGEMKLPGEVGRDEITGDDLITHIPKGRTVIILRKEGTGKEEEDED